MRCVICSKGPQDGLTLHRINAKGQPGVWACSKHRGNTDAPPLDPALGEVIRILENRHDR